MTPPEEDFRIDRVEPCRLISHSDYTTLPHLYVLSRIKGPGSVRLRLPLRAAWHVGDVVRVALSSLISSAI